MRRWRCAPALALLLLSGCFGGKEEVDRSYAPDIGGTESAAPNAAQEQQVLQAVQGRLDADPDLKAARLKVKVSGGQIELTGTVAKPEWKERAETIVFEVLQEKPGAAAGVLNTIEVTSGY